MARTSFYDDNRFRRFPFVSTAEIESAPEAADQLPDSVLLDCGFTFLAYSGFDPAVHQVWLASVGFGSDSVTLQFESDAPGVADAALVFTCPRDGLESQIRFSELTGTGTNEIDGGCTDQPLWLGFVAIGDTQALVDWAGTSPQTLDAGQHLIEPGSVQSLDGSYVRSINLANRQRVRVDDDISTARPILINSQCMQGPARFIEGVNCQIDYDLPRNGLKIAASVGGGAGEPCAEIPLVEDEEPPDGSSLLSGGPTCREVVKTVNGLGGPRLTIRGVNGISVVHDETVPNQLNIKIDGSLLASQESS